VRDIRICPLLIFVERILQSFVGPPESINGDCADRLDSGGLSPTRLIHTTQPGTIVYASPSGPRHPGQRRNGWCGPKLFFGEGGQLRRAVDAVQQLAESQPPVFFSPHRGRPPPLHQPVSVRLGTGSQSSSFLTPTTFFGRQCSQEKLWCGPCAVGRLSRASPAQSTQYISKSSVLLSYIHLCHRNVTLVLYTPR